MEQTNTPNTPTPPVKPPGSKLTLIIGFIILIIVASISIYYLGKQSVINKQSQTSNQNNIPTQVIPTQTITPKVNGTEGWKTYSNNVIQFKYPQSWNSYSKEKENFVVIYNKDSADIRFFLADDVPFKPSKKMTFEEKAEAHKNYWTGSTSELGDANPKQISKTKIVVDDNDGIKYVFRLENTEWKYRQAVWVYLPYGEKIISIRSVGVDEEIINQILSTFKFTDQNTTSDSASLEKIRYTLPQGWEAEIRKNYLNEVDLFISPKSGGYFSISVYDYPSNIGRREYYCQVNKVCITGTTYFKEIKMGNIAGYVANALDNSGNGPDYFGAKGNKFYIISSFSPPPPNEFDKYRQKVLDSLIF